MEWKIIQDGLPPKGKRVLCVTDTGYMEIGFQLNCKMYRGVSSTEFSESGYRITHWMELPSLPNKNNTMETKKTKPSIHGDHWKEAELWWNTLTPKGKAVEVCIYNDISTEHAEFIDYEVSDLAIENFYTNKNYNEYEK